MNTTAKIVAGIVIVLVVAGGAYYWLRHNTSTSSNSPEAGAGAFSSSTGSALKATLPGGTSDSDTALTQDTAAIDTQMNALNSDSANMNSSLNDQPISQSY